MDVLVGLILFSVMGYIISRVFGESINNGDYGSEDKIIFTIEVKDNEAN